jgi:hypothetical protein
MRAGFADAGCLDGSLTAKPICGNCGRLTSPEFECQPVSVELITDPGRDQARLIFLSWTKLKMPCWRVGLAPHGAVIYVVIVGKVPEVGATNPSLLD